MRVNIRSTKTFVVLAGIFAVGVVQAQIPHHRIVQTLYPSADDIPNVPDHIRFGAAVGVRNQRALIGIPDAPGGGRVALFGRSSSGVWIRTGTLKAGGDSDFGSAITLHNDTAVIGSKTAAYVYKLRNGTWRRVEKLLPPFSDRVDHFATSLAYQDGMAVIGALRADGRGIAYVFRLSSAGKRVGMQRLQSADGHVNDEFGADVSMTHHTVVVGAPQQMHISANAPAGAAYVFTRSNETWRQTQKLVSTELDPADGFGAAVAIDRGMILVGAPWADRFDGRIAPPYNDVVEGGAVYGFVPESGLYTETLKLRPTNDSFDLFGNDIVMFDRFIAVAAQDPYDLGGGTISYSFAWTFDRNGSIVTPRAKTWSGFVGNSLALANNWLLSGTPVDSARCGLACIGEAILIDMNYLQ